VLAVLLDEVNRLRAARRAQGLPTRLVVGIAGAPGAGKTTLAAALAEVLSAAVVVPMDGFHLANVELQRLGRADRKGAPDTFDADGFVALLRRLRAADAVTSDEVIYAPAFDHVLNEPVAGSIPISSAVEVVVTEGNYLLLDIAPWDRVRPLLDLSVYLEADDSERIAGLIDRQRAKGLPEPDAHEWVHRSDEANARLVASTHSRADLRLQR
jgi:pantothenate kinase